MYSSRFRVTSLQDVIILPTEHMVFYHFAMITFNKVVCLLHCLIMWISGGMITFDVD